MLGARGIGELYGERTQGRRVNRAKGDGAEVRAARKMQAPANWLKKKAREGRGTR